MKKCPWCGKEYPDDISVCSTDRNPLASCNPIPSAISPPVIQRPAIHEKISIPPEILFRTIVCVVLGIVCWWYPMWYLNHYDPQNDADLAGMALIPGIFAIVGFGIWGTFGLRYLTPIGFGGKQLAIIVGILVLCWFPIIVLFLRALCRGFLFGVFLFGAPLSGAFLLSGNLFRRR